MKLLLANALTEETDDKEETRTQSQLCKENTEYPGCKTHFREKFTELLKHSSNTFTCNI